MKRLTILVLSLISFIAQAGPHVVFVLGEREYETLETVPQFFETTLKPEGYTATFFAAPSEGEKRDDFSGLAEELKKADVCFISVRRRAPDRADMAALKQFVADGKPLVAIRTSSHAFHLRGDPAPEGKELWEEFDPEILGGTYHGHYKEELAQITVAKGAAEHPILKGVGTLPSSDKLYQPSPLSDTTTLLLKGTIEGKNPEPVAWTNSVGENHARIFYTSLGQPVDFDHAEFQKLLKNAIAWATEEG
tara:strand:- start:821 stop:1567 length:747 start_codon:yes stop_codon:yes gene_type:complete